MNAPQGYFRLLPLVLVAIFGLAGCAREISPNVVTGQSVGETMQTHLGVIESARFVQVKESETLEGNTTGLLLGGLAGGAAGSRIGGGFGRTVATGVGAAAGAAVGAVAEQELKRQNAIEYVVRTDSGQRFTVVQGLTPQLQPGTRVYLQISRTGRSRVVPAS